MGRSTDFVKFIISKEASPYQLEDVFFEITPNQLLTLRELITNVKKRRGNEWIDKFYRQTIETGRPFRASITAGTKFITQFLNQQATRAQLKKWAPLLAHGAQLGWNMFRQTGQPARSAQSKRSKPKKKAKTEPSTSLESDVESEATAAAAASAAPVTEDGSSADDETSAADNDDDDSYTEAEKRLIGKHKKKKTRASLHSSPTAGKGQKRKSVFYLDSDSDSDDNGDDDDDTDDA